MKQSESSIRIGTSGWSYKHWHGIFYPDDLPSGKELEYYVQHFDTTEINNTFYRLPTPEATQKWHDRTPENFEFAVKLNRFITHIKRLKDPQNPLERFFTAIAPLKEKTGPILIQTPPKWGINLDRLETFLNALPKNQKYTFEFRDHSWHTDEVAALLKEHRAAFCIYELAGYTAPKYITADFTYIRLHGPGEEKYQGKYGKQGIKPWIRAINKWRSENLNIYVYFDNDQKSYAVYDAKELIKLVSVF